MEARLCFDQTYCMQSTKAALLKLLKYFSKFIYHDSNIEERGGGDFNSLYELVVLEEMEGKENIFPFDQKTYCPERMVKKTRRTKVSK